MPYVPVSLDCQFLIAPSFDLSFIYNDVTFSLVFDGLHLTLHVENSYLHHLLFTNRGGCAHNMLTPPLLSQYLCHARKVSGHKYVCTILNHILELLRRCDIIVFFIYYFDVDSVYREV